MKNKPLETIATVILAGVCAALIFRLAVRVRSVHAGSPAPVHPAARGRAAIAVTSRPAAFEDSPVLNVALYQQLQSQPVTPPERDPFSFEPTPQQIEQAGRERTANTAANTGPPAPPPPPPLPFKTVGYSVTAEGQIEAYVSSADQIYALHEGEVFDKGYRVVRITPALIEIQDDLYHRAVELPFPQ
ncbi:MAG TPA: hypothetical protein VGY31_03585 [Terriglobia bacterium]|nr:hypothetical protein [Terriglobia bacterium]